MLRILGIQDEIRTPFNPRQAAFLPDGSLFVLGPDKACVVDPRTKKLHKQFSLAGYDFARFPPICPKPGNVLAIEEFGIVKLNLKTGEARRVFTQSVLAAPLPSFAILGLIVWIGCWFLVCRRIGIRLETKSFFHERVVFWAGLAVACLSCTFWLLLLLTTRHEVGPVAIVVICGCILTVFALAALSVVNLIAAIFAKGVLPRVFLVYLAVLSGPQICCLSGFVGVMPA